MKTFVAFSIIIAIAKAGRISVDQPKQADQSKNSLLEPEAQETIFYQSPYYFPQSESYSEQLQSFEQSDLGYHEGYERQTDDKAAKVVSYNQNYDKDSYKYEFELDNGIKTQEEGHKNGKNLEVQGSYSFTGPDGKSYSVAYIADENGFRAAGDHLPTPPPIPDDILKSIEQNSEDEAQGIRDDGSYKKEYENEEFSKNIFDTEQRDFGSSTNNNEEVPKFISSGVAPSQFHFKIPSDFHAEEPKLSLNYQSSYEAPKKHEYKIITHKKPKHYSHIQHHEHKQFDTPSEHVSSSHNSDNFLSLKGFEKYEPNLQFQQNQQHIPQSFGFGPSDAKFQKQSIENTGFSGNQFENQNFNFNQEHQGLHQFSSLESFKAPEYHFNNIRQQHQQEPHPVYENENQDFLPMYDGFAATENKPVTYGQSVNYGPDNQSPEFEAQASNEDIPSIQTVDYYPVPNVPKQSETTYETTNQQPVNNPIHYRRVPVHFAKQANSEQKLQEQAHEASQHQAVVSQKVPSHPLLKNKVRNQEIRGFRGHSNRHGSLVYEGSQNIPVVTSYKHGAPRSQVKTFKTVVKHRNSPLMKITKRQISK